MKDKYGKSIAIGGYIRVNKIRSSSISSASSAAPGDAAIVYDIDTTDAILSLQVVFVSGEYYWAECENVQVIDESTYIFERLSA